MKKTTPVILGAWLLLAACPQKPRKPAPPPEQRQRTATQAVAALQAGQFHNAGDYARKVLKSDPGNPQARITAALSAYMIAMHDFVPDLLRRLQQWERARDGDKLQGTLHRRFKAIEKKLAGVDRHLKVAARSSWVTLELCLACWRRDWNHNGRIDWRDERVFQIEQDAHGKPIPRDDPRRKPTFRFDVGDVHWARAMVAFQRALFNLLAAYELPPIRAFQASLKRGRLTIKLISKKRVRKARKLILAGLMHADRARRAYLAETDDHAEWVPNPTQKNHPLPLPVDKTLYETWKGVTADLIKLIQGKEGISVAEVAQLGDHKWQHPPRGYIHVGRLLTHPGDIVLHTRDMKYMDPETGKGNVDKVLTGIFGDKYVTNMKPTRLIKRLSRMKREVSRGQESLGRKLRYFFWFN